MASKTIVVLGGTGPTGIIFIEKAIQRGHNVVVYARNPSKLGEKLASDSKVKVIKGGLLNEELLSSAIQGSDAIVSVLGPSSLKTPPGTFTEPYKLVFKLMRQHGVKRILAMGTDSITDSKDKSSLVARLMVFVVWLLGRPTWQEIVNIGKTFDGATDLDWTIYRLGLVKNGPDGPAEATHVGSKTWGSTINRNELAGWLLDQVEKAEPEYVREKPALCSGKK
ncbi:NAD(P)-binding protein [Lepidopterella palustris CBS 459.81]|uniref:NAD(P)-binding protein n=1 Tax=Lepidopterella palustris CBS 459.81 TaxID=1314670 RepID=A0A8E2JKH2_9PEZI|nr:NAD(P)-binding protein [Lepidopterella palustris CBS 459.81]